MKYYTFGLDFGTESARSLLVDVQTGEVAEAVSMGYADGGIDSHLPGTSAPLPPDFALQNPQDWLTTLELLMQIYADIAGREFAVSASPQVLALGAAMLASVAAGTENGGHSNLGQAAASMVPKPVQTFRPNTQNKKTYDLLYNEYLQLGRYFSEDNPIMKTLAGLRKLP